MIKLVDKSLSAQATKRLANYQKAIDDELTYEAQVQKANARWKPKNKTFNEITRTLITMCPGTRRCCYCEDSMGTDIEHFKPKSLYPELTFVWENYLFACDACNSNAKRNQFAVFDAIGTEHDITRANKAPIVKPIAGDPLLINPRYEDPLHFLKIGWNDFHFIPKSDLSERDKRRADYTIGILKLNSRVELVEWRTQAFTVFVGWVHTYRHYQQADPARLAEHISGLSKLPHFVIWQEMQRTYRERDSRWERLKSMYRALRDIDDIFTPSSELLAIPT